MSHGRTQIRSALATALTGLTTTAGRVFVNRVHPVTDAELPCLMISLDQEQINYDTLKPPRSQSRTTTATVRTIARSLTGVDSTLDASLLEIEAAIYNNRTLNGLVRDIKVDAFGVELDDGAERPTGVGSTTLSIHWATLEGSPQTTL